MQDVSIAVYTSIHRQLGLGFSPLTSELIRDAVKDGVREVENLDWKRGAYDLSNDASRYEAAKDICAMANSGGGFIFFGVAEKQGVAKEIVPVHWSEADERKVRQVAANHIEPPIYGLHFHRIEQEDGSVVALEIPDSLDEVAFVKTKDGAFRAPYRDGAETVFYRPTQFRDLYERALRSEAERLRFAQQVHEHDLVACEPDGGLVLTIVAVPRSARRNLSADGNRSAMQEILRKPVPGSIGCPGANGVTRLFWSGEAIGTGYHSVVSQNQRGSERRFIRSLHVNGATSCGYRIGGVGLDGDLLLRARDERQDSFRVDVLECSILDFLSLVQAHSLLYPSLNRFDVILRLTSNRGAVIQANVLRRDSNEIYNAEGIGGRPISSFRTVDGYIGGVNDPEALMLHARELVLDVINQAGLDERVLTYTSAT